MMTSPAPVSNSASVPLTIPVEKLKSDISNRPFDPYATLILLSSLALHNDNSRVGYREGYMAAHHLIRNEPKQHQQEETSAASSSNNSLMGKVQAVTTNLVQGTVNFIASTASATQTAMQRGRVGACSERDVPRIEEVFIRFVHNKLKTQEDHDLLNWAIKGLEKIAKGYECEQKTKREIDSIIEIGKNALGIGTPEGRKILPNDYKPYFGREWTFDEIRAFHRKLQVSFHLITVAMPAVDKEVKQGLTQRIKIAIGTELQKEIEDGLKSKADEYEQYMKSCLEKQNGSSSPAMPAVGTSPATNTTTAVSPGNNAAAAASPANNAAAASPAAETKGQVPANGARAAAA